MKNRNLATSIVPVLALALLAACNGQPPQGVNGENVVNGATTPGKATGAAPAAAAQSPAQALGLVAPTGKLAAGQMQVLDTNGRPVAGAEVSVGDVRLTTDALGIVTFPATLTDTEKHAAIIKAPGFVGSGQDVLLGYAVKLTPVDAARTTVTANGGGTALNSERNMEVVFPPGSLTADSQVAVTRLFGANGLPGQRLPEDFPFKAGSDKTGANAVSFKDAGYKLADNRPFGTYEYSFDLGEGVQLAPGSSVIVRFKAEGAMKNVLAARYAKGDKFENASESVSRDAEGNFWLAMRVTGPSAVAGNGAADALASTAAAAKRQLLAAACRSFSDIETSTFMVQKQWTTMIPGIEVPIWVNGYRTRNEVSANEVNAYASYSGGGCVTSWTAQQYESNQYNMQDGSAIPGWITLVTHNGAVNGGRCVYYQFDPNQYYCQGGRIYVKDPGVEWQTTYRTWTSKSINAIVNWLSDDARVKGPVAGARVDFAHSLAPVRNNVALSVNTAADGFAETIGVENSYGTATASLASQPFTYGSNAGYWVNCSTVGLNIVKMMPRVALRTTLHGKTVGATPLVTSHGDFTYDGDGTVLKPTIDLDKASARFSIDGARQPDATTWVEATSGAIDATWNGSHNLPTDIWVSRQIGTTLTYQSNDTDPTLPTDQRPQLTWGGSVAKADVTFTHEQSTYAKKSRAEGLKFNSVSAAGTWGISGATSTISAQRETNGVTLTGTASTTVSGNTVPVGLNANLPAVVFQMPTGAAGTYIMTYELTDANGKKREATMRITLTGGSELTFSLPVEEEIGNAGKHSFRVVSLLTEDASHVLYLTGKSLAYPTLADIHRGGKFPYPATFEAGFISAK